MDPHSGEYDALIDFDLVLCDPKNRSASLPVPEAFRDAESYASTKAHELTHWAMFTNAKRDFLFACRLTRPPASGLAPPCA